MKLNKKELKRLFNETIKNLEEMEESITFNLYEDLDCYSMETAFDDENFVICRDNPAILCKKNIDFEAVLKLVEKEIVKFIKTNQSKLIRVQEISYGFVDGDLYYIEL